MKRLLFLPVCLLIVSCATSYKPEGFGGGYTDMPLGGSRYRIDVRGNGLASMKTVQDIAFVRAADLTLRSGYKYFVVLDSGQNVQTKYGTVSGTLVSANNHYTTLIIKLLADGDAGVAEAIDAKKILSTLGPSVGYAP